MNINYAYQNYFLYATLNSFYKNLNLLIYKNININYFMVIKF